MLIIIEGIDFCGKTTFTGELVRVLRELGREVVHTREPGGTPVGEEIRSVVLNPDTKCSPTTELFLMFAARNEHLESVIRPALADNKIVICDRFIDSSYAYQVSANFDDDVSSANGKLITCFHDLESSLGDIPERKVFYLDILLSAVMDRMKNSQGLDRFEKRGMEFFNKVDKAFKFRSSVREEGCVKEVLDVNVTLVELLDLAKAKALEINNEIIKRKKREG